MNTYDLVKTIRELDKSLNYKRKLPINNYNNQKNLKNGEMPKIHEKQLRFHRDPAKNRWVFGGNRTGKTECGAVEAVYYAAATHPHRKIEGACEGWVVSLSTQVQRDVAQAKILHYLDSNLIVDIVMISGKKEYPERGIIDYILVRNKHGSISKIGFKSCDQGREKFQGTGLDWVWFDEEPPFDIYEECLLRTLDKGGTIWGTMTPLKGRTWVYEKIYLRSRSPEDGGQGPGSENYEGDISVIFMSWHDNPFLNLSEIACMEKNLSPESLESRKFGRFMEGTGLVFPEFTDENIIDPFPIPSNWYKSISIDPGFTNPTAVLWLAVDPDENLYVTHDYLVPEKTVAHHSMAIKQISTKLAYPPNRNGFFEALIDSASLQRTLSAQKSVAELFYDNGIQVNTRVNKEVFESIQRIKALLCDVNANRKLFVFKNCTHLIKELRSYWWGDNEKPVKKNDHCIDALRYFVGSNYTMSKSPSGVLSELKKKIIRQNRSRM